MRRLFAFTIVGGAGFAVDVAVLMALLEWTRTDQYSARICAIAMALLVTWTLNRHFTFGKSDRHAAIEGMQYGTVGVLGNVLNFAVYSSLLVLFPHISPIAALCLGSASGTIFAYTGYSKVVFRR